MGRERESMSSILAEGLAMALVIAVTPPEPPPHHPHHLFRFTGCPAYAEEDGGEEERARDQEWSSLAFLWMTMRG